MLSIPFALLYAFRQQKPRGLYCCSSLDIPSNFSLVSVTVDAFLPSDVSVYRLVMLSSFGNTRLLHLANCLELKLPTCDVPCSKQFLQQDILEHYFSHSSICTSCFRYLIKRCTFLWKSELLLLIQLQQWMNWHSSPRIYWTPHVSYGFFVFGSSWWPSLSTISTHQFPFFGVQPDFRRNS